MADTGFKEVRMPKVMNCPCCISVKICDYRYFLDIYIYIQFVGAPIHLVVHEIFSSPSIVQ